MSKQKRWDLADLGKRMIEAWTTKHPNQEDDFLREYMLWCLTKGDTTEIDSNYVALNALRNHPAGTPCTIKPSRIKKELDEAGPRFLTVAARRRHAPK